MPMNFSNLRISLSKLGHWAKEQIVAEVPDDLAVCEFDCRKSQCSWDEWVSCERRISKAAGELMPLESLHDDIYASTYLPCSEQTTEELVDS